MIKIATICSGIGAPEKGLRNLGIDFETVYFCEFDRFATQSYCAIHSEDGNKNLGDLTKVEIERLPKNLDLLVGGTPCQDFSVAGKRAGGEVGSETRSSLMWNFVEIIRETKPRVVLWENVPGCLTAGKMKSNFTKFYRTLGELGYRVNAKILNAKNYGIPQNRDRVFLIATRKDLNIAFEMPDGYDCGVRLRDKLENEVDEKYFLSDKAINGIINSTFSQKVKIVQNKNGVCGTILSRDYKDPKCVYQNGLIELTKNQSQGNRVYDPKGISVTLSANGGGGGAETGLYQVPHGDNKGGFREVDHCPTITTSAFEQNNFVIYAIRGREKKGETHQQLEVGGEISNAITTVEKDSLVIDMYNKSVRKDGLAGTLTTGTAHNGSGTFGVIVGSAQKTLP